MERCLFSGVEVADLANTAWVPTWLNLLGKRFSDDFLALATSTWVSGVVIFSAIEALGVSDLGVLTLGVPALGVLILGESALGVLIVGDFKVFAFGVSITFLGVLAFLVIVIVSGELACPVEEVEAVFTFLGVFVATLVFFTFFTLNPLTAPAFITFLGVLPKFF